MNLENLETKEPLIKEFFTWLFDDDRIIQKDVTLENEIDLTLAPHYMDANIYYPKQIADFFNAKAMKRLERISQLDLAIDEFSNVYHNRLDHSKGVYYRKLEEMLHNFQNPLWKEQIENSKMKIYLIAELIKMAGHDIGHLPLSHALEVQIFSHRGTHEIIGKRIMLENPEINSILTSISPDLPNALKDLYEKPILNFEAHDESNYDVDRFDYISRDSLYAGSPVFLPYTHYESIPVVISSSGLPETDVDGSILTCNKSNFTIDVYEYSSLRNIENFLEIRENQYKNMYFSHKTHVRENTINALFESFLPSCSQSGKDLQNFVTTLTSCDINDIDLSLFLEWDDIKFYSQILDIAENHEDHNVRQLATMVFPNMNAFLTMLYSHLHLNEKNKKYSPQDENFLRNIKRLIKSDSQLSRNLRNPNFAMDNTLLYPQNTPLPAHYNTFIKNGLIRSSTLKIKAYKTTEPIYVKGTNGKIYELSHHPDRQCDWDSRITYINNVYSYIPFLKLNGLSDDAIKELRDFCNSALNPIYSEEARYKVNMQPLQVGHNIEDCFLEL